MDNAPSPLLSVLMPVYNGEEHLVEAIRSIIGQSFSDFEFLVINDGSTDNSQGIVEGFSRSDPRVRLVNQERNLGVTACLNHGLRMARGKYIARMDADDISLPERFARQVDFMEKNPTVGICGSWVKSFGSSMDSIILRCPLDHERIVCHQMFASAFAHPSVIIRGDVIRKHGLSYSERYPHAEDYEFWVRCSRYTELANIDEVLLLLRQHGKNVSSVHSKTQQSTTRTIREEQIRNLGIIPSEKEMEIHDRIANEVWGADRELVSDVDAWTRRLHSANREVRRYPEPYLSQLLARKWHALCLRATQHGLWTWNTYLKSPLRPYSPEGMRQELILAVRCLLRRGYWRSETDI